MVLQAHLSQTQENVWSRFHCEAKHYSRKRPYMSWMFVTEYVEMPPFPFPSRLSSNVPKVRMLMPQIPHLLFVQPYQPSIPTSLPPHRVLPSTIPNPSTRQHQNQNLRHQIHRLTNRIQRSVSAQITPRRDDTTQCPQTDDPCGRYSTHGRPRGIIDTPR